MITVSNLTATQPDSLGPQSALVVLWVLFGLLSIFTILFHVIIKRRNASYRILSAAMCIATAVTLVIALVCQGQYGKQDTPPKLQTDPPSITLDTQSHIAETTEETTTPLTEDVTTLPTTPEFIAEKTENSDPANLGVQWKILQNGSIIEDFTRQEPISFGDPEMYTSQTEGVITFRGDNYRTGPTYGTADISQETVSQLWSTSIGSYNGWSGCGWTGQPLIVRWEDEMRSIMNLYQEKKEKADLVEVIYATLDGYIYFLDLDDGSKTRDPIFMGMNFKGAGSLDPRGYPLMYVGSGDNVNGKSPRMYIVSLIDGSILWERTGADGFAERSWYAFDSAPLIHAESDCLIWPGESGILYTLKLNAQFDATAGTISIAPEETVKICYTTATGRTLGSECSSIIVDKYLYIGDNGGMFFCIDLNTMELVWALDLKDDINATPVFEWAEDGNGYLHVATSMEFARGTSYIYKINAKNGDIVWERAFSGIVYDKDVSGGVLSSSILGRVGTDMEGLVIYSISKTPNSWDGILVALDTQTGETVWEKTLSSYAWSSPAPVYTHDGTAYILLGDSAGNINLLSGSTGEICNTLSLGSNIEASPAIFENIAVVGVRGERIYGIQLQ